jgi:hypothetical protein
MALDFTGSSAHRIQVSGSALQNFTTWTFALWFYCDAYDLTRNQRYWHISTGGASPVGQKELLSRGGGMNSPQIQSVTDTTGSASESRTADQAGSRMVNGQWQFFAATLDGSLWTRIYWGDLNTQVAECSYDFQLQGTGTVVDDDMGIGLIGNNEDMDAAPDGRIAWATWCNSALSLAQLQYLQFAPQGLKHFATQQGIWVPWDPADVIDYSGNGNHGIAAGGPTIGDHVPARAPFFASFSSWSHAATSVLSASPATAITEAPGNVWALAALSADSAAIADAPAATAVPGSVALEAPVGVAVAEAPAAAGLSVVALTGTVAVGIVDAPTALLQARSLLAATAGVGVATAPTATAVPGTSARSATPAVGVVDAPTAVAVFAGTLEAIPAIVVADAPSATPVAGATNISASPTSVIATVPTASIAATIGLATTAADAVTVAPTATLASLASPIAATAAVALVDAPTASIASLLLALSATAASGVADAPSAAVSRGVVTIRAARETLIASTRVDHE